MKLTRRLVQIGALVVSIWLLLPVIQSYNNIILEWFNTLLDDALVERRTLDTVAAMHHDLFWSVIATRLVLLILLLVATRVVLRRTRPAQ